jgi:hypothetical protein
VLGQVERLRANAAVEVPTFVRGEAEHARATAASALGDAAFSAAFARGQAADQVVPAG